MNRTQNWQLALDVINQLHIPVFPCREKDISFSSNGRIINRKAKSPYTKNGYKDATTSLEKVDQLWAKNQHAMVGVPMGSASGIFAIDIDEGTNKSGEATFASLGLEEPNTVQTRTMSGGRHLFFRLPEDIEIRNDTSTVFGPYIDVRGEGGYVIWAGSQSHQWDYRYIDGMSPLEVDFAEMPRTYLAFFEKKKIGSLLPLTKEGTRNNTLFSATVMNVNSGLSDTDVVEEATVYNRTFYPPLGQDEVENIIASALRYRDDNRLKLTDLGNAERFNRDHAESICYVPESKNWYHYEEGIWRPDLAKANQLMHKTVRKIATESKGSIINQKLILKWAERSESHASIKAALSVASNLETLVKPISDFDVNPNLLNLKNGTLDTSSFNFKKHCPTDFLTNKTHGHFDKNAQAPRWQKFIEEVTDGNEDNQRYLQKFCGYLLMGQRPEQIIFFIIGDGGDGKTVFVETLKHIFGDYQTTLSAHSISSHTSLQYQMILQS